MSTTQVPDITRSVQFGIKWIREVAEELTDARDLAICISAVVKAERNPHSPLIQRLIHLLVRQQAIIGSWNEELWDTVWAARALYDVGSAVNTPKMYSALRFL
jgi:hypothetical protein